MSSNSTRPDPMPQGDPAVREWNLAESCDPGESLPVPTASPAFQRAFRSASNPHSTTESRQFSHCLWRDIERRSTWSGIVQFALQHTLKVGVNYVFSSYRNVRNLALGMIRNEHLRPPWRFNLPITEVYCRTEDPPSVFLPMGATLIGYSIRQCTAA